MICRPQRTPVDSRCAAGLSWWMPQHRRSRWPRILLGILLAMSVLLPELGHSLAHRDIEAAHHHDHGVWAAADIDAAVLLERADTSASHLHPDIRAVASGKTTVIFPHPVAAVILPLDRHVSQPRRVPSHQVNVRADSWHGLPPPSRAPPLS
jgi:hypothetical protein